MECLAEYDFGGRPLLDNVHQVEHLLVLFNRLGVIESQTYKHSHLLVE